MEFRIFPPPFHRWKIPLPPISRLKFSTKYGEGLRVRAKKAFDESSESLAMKRDAAREQKRVKTFFMEAKIAEGT